MSRAFYVVSQGGVTLSSAAVIFTLSFLGDSVNVFRLGLFYSIFAILQSTLSLRYELGMYINGAENKGAYLRIAIFNNLLLSFVIIVCVWFVQEYLSSYFGLSLKEFLYAICASSLGSLTFVIKQYLVLLQKTTLVSVVNTISIFVLVLVSLYSYINIKEYFYECFVLSLMFSNIVLIVLFISMRMGGEKVSAIEFVQLTKKGKKFALYSTPGLFVNLSAQNFLVLYFGALGDQQVTAQLVVILRLMSMPATLFSLPLSHVISSHLSQKISLSHPIKPMFINVCLFLFGGAVLYHFLLYILPNEVISFVGITPQIWATIFPVLVVLSIIKTAVSPISQLINVMKRQRAAFSLQMLNLLTILILLIFDIDDLETGVLLYVLGSLFCQISVFVYLSRLVLNNDKLLR